MESPISSGHGFIHAALLPPNRMVLSTLNFKYPLKLISPTASQTSKCLTVFMLSYGGGLVSGDAVDLKCVVEEGAKLCLQTQGSTKIFKHNPATPSTSQRMWTTIHPNAALLLVPEPVQPFAQSAYVQHQTFHLLSTTTSSICILDWVTEGRAALKENWSFERFESRNEVFDASPEWTNNGQKKERLLLRDALILEGDISNVSKGKEKEMPSLRDRQDSQTVIATVVIRGDLFMPVVEYIQTRYKNEPRIGAKRWDSEGAAKPKTHAEEEMTTTGVLWTVSNVRGFLLVKVSGKDIEGVKNFIRRLLDEGACSDGKEIGCIERAFGPGCMRCLD